MLVLGGTFTRVSPLLHACQDKHKEVAQAKVVLACSKRSLNHKNIHEYGEQMENRCSKVVLIIHNPRLWAHFMESKSSQVFFKNNSKAKMKGKRFVQCGIAASERCLHAQKRNSQGKHAWVVDCSVFEQKLKISVLSCRSRRRRHSLQPLAADRCAWFVASQHCTGKERIGGEKSRAKGNLNQSVTYLAWLDCSCNCSSIASTCLPLSVNYWPAMLGNRFAWTFIFGGDSCARTVRSNIIPVGLQWANTEASPTFTQEFAWQPGCKMVANKHDSALQCWADVITTAWAEQNMLEWWVDQAGSRASGYHAKSSMGDTVTGSAWPRMHLSRN